jgi:hypothetical protein
VVIRRYQSATGGLAVLAQTGETFEALVAKDDKPLRRSAGTFEPNFI